MTSRTRVDAPEDVAARSLTHLRRIYHAIHAASSSIESAVGITGPQLWALHAVADAPDGLSLGEIADKLVLHKANAGRLVERLLQKKLVTRERPEHDRRLAIVRATPKGLALLSEPTPKVAQRELLVRLAQLPPAQLRGVERTLAMLVAMLGAGRLEPGAIVEAPPP